MRILLVIMLSVTMHSLCAQEDRLFKDVDKELLKRVEVYTKRAIASFPKARKRFLSEFKQGDSLFVTVRASEGNVTEQFFVKVKRIKGKDINGEVCSHIESLKEIKKGDAFAVSQDEIIDWCIILKNGEEEGNYVGRYAELFNDRYIPLLFSLKRSKDNKLINPKFEGAFSAQGQKSDFILNDKNIKDALSMIVIKQSKLIEDKEVGLLGILHFDLHRYKLGTLEELQINQE